MNWVLDLLWRQRTYNDMFTLLLYWLPLAFNAVAYAIRVFQRVQSDKAAVRDDRKFHDWLKVGDLIGYAAATVIPLANLCCFVFDTMGELWKLTWSRLDWLFNIRLVPGPSGKDGGA